MNVFKEIKRVTLPNAIEAFATALAAHEKTLEQLNSDESQEAFARTAAAMGCSVDRVREAARRIAMVDLESRRSEALRELGVILEGS